MQQVLEYLKSNEQWFIQELCEYVRFPSVSAQPQHKDDLTACANWVFVHCQGIGLSADIFETAGNPIVLAKTFAERQKDRPHFLVYGHYDVQPPEPLELWTSPPFEPRIEGRSLFARGACDNKGQHFAHLKAVEAYFKTGTELPCDLTFLIEGEEEVGCTNLEPFLQQHRDELKCDAVVISDTGMPSLKYPALTYALRGIAAMEVVLHGPSRDLHSGIYGGTVENPAMALCQMLASVRDKNGKITIPGFYKDVVPLSAYEKKQLARIPYTDADYKKLLGVEKLFGERGFTWNEQRSSRPTFEINGLTSGYQGDGSKTIIPAWARAKITMRLVPDQKPDAITALVEKHLKKICPPTVRLEITADHGGEPYVVSPTSSLAKAALRALKAAFECEPVLLREGGSIPIVNDFKRILGVDSILVGLALPDDNPHSPNEKFDLEAFSRGMAMGALLWPELTAATDGKPSPRSKSAAKKQAKKKAPKKAKKKKR
ncbi:MAG TPA: dipeptidase [Verrucomicrobiae bacterium]|nr:dipeptidase [Verrucomicrobiae bacterium]